MEHGLPKEIMPLKHRKWSGSGELINGNYHERKKETTRDSVVNAKVGGMKCLKRAGRFR